MKTTVSIAVALLLFVGQAAYAQFTYFTNNGTIAITGYTGPNGDVVIPSTIDGMPVTAIWAGAFSGNANLTSVTIPNSIYAILEWAFFGCPNLDTVLIGSGLTNIDIRADALDGCLKLTAISVDTDNPVYSSVGGVFFDKNQTQLIKYPTGRIGSYSIPTSVTTIGEHAFLQCTGLTSVNIPNSVTTIGDAAFANCTSLTSVPIPDSVDIIGGEAFFDDSGLTNVTIPDSVTSVGGGAFGDCTSLTSITIPNSVITIWDGAFSGDTSLTSITIPNGVTTVWDLAFSGDTSLTNVTIPASVASIGLELFAGCPNLRAITVERDNPVYSSVDGVLFDKSQATLIEYPAGKVGPYSVPNNVTTIGVQAFDGCFNLTSVTFPYGLATIGQGALRGCNGLASIYFQGDAPRDVVYPFGGLYGPDHAITVYYLPGTTGWSTDFFGAATARWTLPYPLMLNGGLSAQSNGFGFTVSWATNASVVVEASRDLKNPEWSPLTTNALSSGTFYFRDPFWTNYPSRFYRLQSQ